MVIYEKLARGFPELETKLRQARIADEPEEYIKKTALMSFFMSFSLTLIVFMFFSNPLALLILVFFMPLLFFYFIKYVDVKIEQLKRKIDQEIVFAGRFLIIELDSGVPIDKAFINIEKNYEVVGKFFGDVMNKVYLGTSLEDALNDTLINTSSPNLRRLLWQILNSIKTGSEVESSLNLIIDQIVREQQIAVKEYGKKLNPIAMFYMMISIIIPSIGTTMLVVFATFMGLNITMPFFIVMATILGFMQFMFLSIIRTQRPSISI